MSEKKRPTSQFIAHFKQALLAPQARYGMIASLTLVFIFVGFLFCVLLFEQIPGQLDMTREQLYSLSQPSRTLLKKVEEDISLSLIWRPDVQEEYNLTQMFDQVNNFLKQYAQVNSHIKYRVIDPVVYPEMVLAYTQGQEQMGHGSIIISSQRHHRVIPFEAWVGFYAEKRVSFNVESPVTHAIAYVMSGRIPKLYTTSGHGEADASALPQSTGQSFAQTLLASNYEVQELNLATQNLPSDAAAVLIMAPTSDFSENEMRAVRTYLQQGGALWLHLSYTETPLTRLEQLVRDYGINAYGLVAEQDEARLIPTLKANPLYFLVQTQPFDITKGLSNLQQMIVMGQSIGLIPLQEEIPTRRIYPLLSASDKSVLFIKDASSKLIRNKENEAINIAYAITQEASQASTSTPGQTRLVLSSGDLQLMQHFPGTAMFYTKSIEWLTHTPESLDIPSKSLVSMPLRILAKQFVLLGFLFIIVVPILIFVAGFAVYRRRRLL